MKFRILTNGSCFKLQVRKLLRWAWIKEPWSCMEYGGYSAKTFSSRASAVDFIVSQYGHSSWIDNPFVQTVGDVPAELKERVPSIVQQAKARINKA